ncbi:MAG TPA: hypothetical protein VEZ90_02405, partial [Blastocatellia bacterium]|nr:hypothetical protein [Blastocatellia bacterium]
MRTSRLLVSALLSVTLVALCVRAPFVRAQTQSCNAAAPQNSNCPGIPLGSGAPTSQLQIDQTNPRYFNYNGSTIALVGASGEYLPSVSQPPFTDQYCTFDNFQCYVQNLRAAGLNTLQLWVALNHSPGIQVGHLNHPYVDEQPFSYPTDANGTPVPPVGFPQGTGKWDLTKWDTGYFNRLKAFIEYCQSYNIIVEVTLFDAFQGMVNGAQSPYSPWNGINNVQNITLSPSSFCALSSSEMAGLPGLTAARLAQVNLMERVAFLLDQYRSPTTGLALLNYYFELANEPDINSADGIDINGTIAWHDLMAQTLYNYETSALGGRHRVVAANYHTPQAIASVNQSGCLSGAPGLCLSGINPATNKPYIGVVSGHYAGLSDTTRESAIKLIRDYDGGSQSSVMLNGAFGFNETKVTGLGATGTSFFSDAARAEAWEFMLDGGALYDNYALQWAYTTDLCQMTDAQNTRRYLGFLNKFLNGDAASGTPAFALAKMARSTNPNDPTFTGPPQWCPNLTSYGSGNFRWGAMHWRNNQYALYIHHSSLTSGQFQRYVPQYNGGPGGAPYITKISIVFAPLPPGTTSLTFKAEWI